MKASSVVVVFSSVGEVDPTSLHGGDDKDENPSKSFSCGDGMAVKDVILASPSPEGMAEKEKAVSPHEG